MSKETKKQFSEKEIKEQRDKMKKFYEENLEFLKTEHEHEILEAEISEARFKRIMFDMKIAELMSNQKEQLKEQEI